MNQGENKKSFLEEIQSLDESTKRRVGFVVTAVIMVGVVYLWLAYFNGVVASVSPAPVAAGQSQQGSSWFAMVGSNMAGAAQWIGRLFTSPGQYTIHP
jgi:hypothetical protein